MRGTLAIPKTQTFERNMFTHVTIRAEDNSIGIIKKWYTLRAR